MGKIQIIESDEAEWVTVHLPPPSEAPGQDVASPQYDARMVVHLEGDESLLHLHEVDHPPNMVAEAHAHDADEIIYVVAGQLVLGNRTLRAGSSVFIPANTLYSFRAGPDGLRFVNFRPRGKVRSIFKDEFMNSRSSK
jgi:quercetin dioxygenase-like cupin family protein